MRIAVWCGIVTLLLLPAIGAFAQRHPVATKPEDAYWELRLRVYDRWYRPRREVLRAAYKQLESLIAQNPQNNVLVGQKLQLLIEMGDLPCLQSYLQDLKQYGGTDASIRGAVDEVERYLQSRRDGLPRTLLNIIKEPWKAEFWQIFGSTVLLLLLAGLVAVLARWQSDRDLSIVSRALLVLAWAAPVARLFAAIVVGSLFTLRRYDTQLSVTLSVLLWGGYMLAAALYFRARLSTPSLAQRPRWARLVLTGIAIFTMILWEALFVDLGDLRRLPEALVATVHGCSGFFVLQSTIHFANNVPLGLMAYGVFYAPIRARFGVPIAILLVTLFWVSVMAEHLVTGWYWLLLSAVRFAISITAGYEGHPSPFTPAWILSLGSLIKVINAILRSQGWNPDLLW